MKRLRNCPGSRRRAEVVPNVSSVYAEEGTAAHALAYSILEARRKGKPEPDTFGYTEEFMEAVYVYVSHVMALASEPGAVQLLEHRFDLNAVYPGCFGTCDCITYIPSRKRLVVTDYKHGGGVFVEVERNDQLMYYGVGAVRANPQWQVDEVVLEIVQPRYNGKGDIIRQYVTDAKQLRAFEDEIRAICKASEPKDAPLASGEWCQFCPVAAAKACPLLEEERKTLARRVFGDNSIQEMDIDEFARQLAWIPIFQAQFKAMHELAYQLAMKGQPIPGWKLVEKEGRREFIDKEEALHEIYDNFGIKIMSMKEVYMSPSQIETLPKAQRNGHTKKEIEKVIATLTRRNSAGYALVPESDGRDATSRKIEATSVFTSAEEELDVFN